MTRDEILNMKAGRTMDALIAMEIFEVDRNTPGFSGLYSWVKDYSTQISAAWEIIEKFDNHCLLNNVHGVWEVYLSNKEGKSKSAPLAICRAALLAVMK